MPSRSSVATKARKKAEADFTTWLMMAKLGGFDELPPNAQTSLTAYRARLETMSEADVRTRLLPETDPDLDCIHDDPRFGKIMIDAKKHLGMAALPSATTAA